MMEADAIKLFKCLADKSRLQILKSLMLEDMYVERLAERLNLTPATISFHLKKLSEIGAVSSYKTQYYTMYSLRQDTFAVTILDILKEQSDEAEIQARREQAYRRKVIDSFFEYGKLKSWKRLPGLLRQEESIQSARSTLSSPIITMISAPSGAT